jgi:hypothetical protein
MTPPDFTDRLAALDARLSRLLDAARRTRHDVENRSETRQDKPRGQR